MSRLMLPAASISMVFYSCRYNNFAALKSTNKVICAVATCSMRSGRDKSVCVFRFPKDP